MGGGVRSPGASLILFLSSALALAGTAQAFTTTTPRGPFKNEEKVALRFEEWQARILRRTVAKTYGGFIVMKPVSCRPTGTNPALIKQYGKFSIFCTSTVRNDAVPYNPCRHRYTLSRISTSKARMYDVWSCRVGGSGTRRWTVTPTQLGMRSW